MNTQLITAAEIKPIIQELGGDISIYRESKNDYGEPATPELVATIKAYFYSEDKSLKMDITIEGRTVSASGTISYRLLTWKDETSSLVQKGDYFVYNDIRYNILDLGNFENAFYHMSLERVM